MKTEIHIQPQTKVQFIDSLKARITLINGDTYIVGFPSPYNHLQGDHFLLLLGAEFDFYWGESTLENNIRIINSDLYRDGYEMMVFLVPENDKYDERKRIGERIKELRKKRNIDAKTLAYRIGIDASNLSRIEQGHYSVGLDILSRIAYALGAKIDLVET
jgi:DNA-binding Xre family transcriptional regulator